MAIIFILVFFVIFYVEMEKIKKNGSYYVPSGSVAPTATNTTDKKANDSMADSTLSFLTLGSYIIMILAGITIFAGTFLYFGLNFVAGKSGCNATNFAGRFNDVSCLVPTITWIVIVIWATYFLVIAIFSIEIFDAIQTAKDKADAATSDKPYTVVPLKSTTSVNIVEFPNSICIAIASIFAFYVIASLIYVNKKESIQDTIQSTKKKLDNLDVSDLIRRASESAEQKVNKVFNNTKTTQKSKTAAAQGSPLLSSSSPSSSLSSSINASSGSSIESLNTLPSTSTTPSAETPSTTQTSSSLLSSSTPPPLPPGTGPSTQGSLYRSFPLTYQKKKWKRQPIWGKP
jgi:hypothetical protein